MRAFRSVSAVVTLAMLAASCAAEEKASRCKLKVGDGVGAFQVVKAGGVDDGVEAGKALCYM